MASLAEREGLRGRVQCIYFDPPYGIKFNSNFQWSTTSRDVKDGKADQITCEPEQVRAFRDTWRDGIHSYLTYLRDRLTVARDLLTDSGSIFVQIGDENVHRVRAVLDEIFGDRNFVGQITVTKSAGTSTETMASVSDYLLWYGRDSEHCKQRPLFLSKTEEGGASEYRYALNDDGTYRTLPQTEIDRITRGEISAVRFRPAPITLQRPLGGTDTREFHFRGKPWTPGNRTYSTDLPGLTRTAKSGRLRIRFSLPLAVAAPGCLLPALSY